jgi:hypothetical protein
MQAQRLPTAFLLTFALALFVWPVVTALPTLQSKILWIVITALLLLLSTSTLVWATKNAPKTRFSLQPLPWMEMTFLCALILALSLSIPPLSFSDELTIAIPATTLLTALHTALGWPLIIGTIVLGAILLTKLSLKQALWVFLLFVGVAIALAVSPIHTTLVVRYPPFVHLMQFVGGILSFTDPGYFRMPNILWTILLVAAVWQGLPHWRESAKWVIVFGLLVGPLGWTYRMALYQATGELTLGIAAVLLLAQILGTKRKKKVEEQTSQHISSALLGILFAVWILYRPTSLAIIGLTLLILLLTKRYRDLLIISGIALPITISWMALSPLYAAEYEFLDNNIPLLSPEVLPEFFRSLLGSFPSAFHPLTLLILLFGTFVVILRGATDQKKLLVIAWLFGLASSLSQNAASPQVFWGIGRYSVLLLLPLGVCLGSLLQGDRFSKTLGVISLALLLAITPFNYTSYTQHLRATSEDIYRTPPEGYLAQPLFGVTKDFLEQGITPTIVAPQYGFLDFFIARGLLTPEERNQIREEGQSWQPKKIAKPLLVQAPISTSYAPNLTQKEEERLRDAHAWALTQPHRVVRLGIEETVVVNP